MNDLPNLEVATSHPESMLSGLHLVDSWESQPSQVFPGFLEIVKTRKDKDSNITIHINPESGSVRKFAGRSSSNPTIEKEAEMWNVALELFGVNEQITVGTIRQLKPDPSRGWEEVKFIEMPYMGIPLSYFEQVNPGIIPIETRRAFTNTMLDLVQNHGIIHTDLNYENVLVRIADGKVQLFPIDWESADKRKTGIEKKLNYYQEVQRKKCHSIFSKYYPEDYT